MSFFSSMFGGAPQRLGASPAASAFTSPGMNPQALAMLMAMQNGGGMGGIGPQLPPVQSQGAGAGAPPPLSAIQAQAQQSMPAQSNAPNALQNIMALLQRLGIGHAGVPSFNPAAMPGQGMGGMPGPGTGGLY